jgi:hypothetical protein
MWNKAKEILRHCLNLVLAVVLLVAVVFYVGINTIILTEVINDLRMDAYVSLETGFGIVMLVFLLGWGPWWLHRVLNR